MAVVKSTTINVRTSALLPAAFTVSGGKARSKVYTAEYDLPVPATPAVLEGRTYIVDTCGARRMMVLFAEAGDTTNRGTVACSATMLVSV